MWWTLLLLPLVPTFLRFVSACHFSLINLRRNHSYAILPFSPNELSIADVVLVVILFVSRSLKRSIGFGSSDASRRHGQATSSIKTSKKSQVVSPSVNPRARSQETKNEGHGEEIRYSLPSLELAMPLHVRQLDIDQYLKAITSQTSSPSSSTPDILLRSKSHQALFLSAISEPALLLLLARKFCPIEPLGAVNVRNRFEILNTDLCHRIILHASTTPPPSPQFSTTTSPNTVRQPTPNDLELSVLSYLPSHSRPANRGIETDVTVSIFARQRKKSNLSEWEDTNTEIFRQVFTILQFTTTAATGTQARSSTTSTNSSSSSSQPQRQQQTTNPRTLHPVRESTLLHAPNLACYITLSPTDPLTWASLCKDYNPIHISRLAARAFGFPGVIAHGNHVVACAIAAIRSSDSDTQEDEGKEDGSCGSGGDAGANGEDNEGWWMEVEFRRPVVLPCEVGVRIFKDDDDDDSNNKRETRTRRYKKEKRYEVFQGEKVFVRIAIGGS